MNNFVEWAFNALIMNTKIETFRPPRKDGWERVIVSTRFIEGVKRIWCPRLRVGWHKQGELSDWEFVTGSWNTRDDSSEWLIRDFQEFLDKCSPYETFVGGMMYIPQGIDTPALDFEVLRRTFTTPLNDAMDWYSITKDDVESELVAMYQFRDEMQQKRDAERREMEERNARNARIRDEKLALERQKIEDEREKFKKLTESLSEKIRFAKSLSRALYHKHLSGSYTDVVTALVNNNQEAIQSWKKKC